MDSQHPKLRKIHRRSGRSRMMSNLDSPVIQIDSLKTKFDTVVVSNSLIALLDYSYDEARFLQQLHYWSYSEYGVVIDGIRWIYKSAREWLSEALAGLSEWKLRKAIASLVEKKLIRKEKLYIKHHQQEYQSPWWNPKNQTCYYSVNYEELQKLIEKAEAGLALAPVLKDTAPHNGDASFPAESIGNIRFENPTKLSIEETKKTKVCELSRNKTKNTNHKRLTDKQNYSDRVKSQSSSFAAATSLEFKEAEKNQKGSHLHLTELTVSPGQTKRKSKPSRSNIGKETNVATVDYIVNLRWKELIPELDKVGIPINKTIKDVLKLYPPQKVESAIALLRARKREHHIPNPSGYFVSALKGDWAGQNLVNEESSARQSSEIDEGAVFRHWYDLARELGYCLGQEIREGEQWICLSGSWEKWNDAVKRGYSLDYLKKIMKRNQGR